jgi:nitrate reductase molybdenum cofactor assembly chaperone NarJ/NarW
MDGNHHMHVDRKILFKILSLLLDYPQVELIDSLQDIDSMLDKIPDCQAATSCRGFLRYLGAHPLQCLQEEYTRTFDLHPAASLNLTCHNHAEGNERGMKMTLFKQVYRAAGFDPVGNELPDFLPMVLEFMYVSPEATLEEMLPMIRPSVETLALNLLETNSPYAGLVKVIADWREACSIEGEA